MWRLNDIKIMLTTHKKGSEKKLIEITTSLKDDPTDFFGLHFRFSDLLEHYKTEYQLKISVNIINDILREAKGNVVITSDYDIFLICKDTEEHLLKKLVFQLRYLYMDDPLAYDEHGEDNDNFAQLYDLSKNWNEFFSAARYKFNELEDWNKPSAYMRNEPQVLTPERLSHIESELGKTNIAHALRRQPICAAKADGFKTMFEEIYINITSLSEMISTEVNLTSNMHLFTYLTQILDRRVLEIVRKSPTTYLRSAISLNLNVESLLSDFFVEFDRNLDAKMKKNIVIEIQASNIFSNIQAFMTATEMLQKNGYRICLDGLNMLGFKQLDRASLGFDLAKIRWNSDHRKDSKSEENIALKEAIERCGKSRIILSRCDNEEAVYFGQSLGIPLFQGRYLDKVVNPESVVVN